MSMPALDTDPPTTVTIESDLLGPIRAADHQVVRFDDGLLGFPDVRHFVLVPAQRTGTYWLQSAEHPSLVFLVIDPFLHFGDYVVELADLEVRKLDADDQTDVAILAIVTLPGEDGEPATANLQGPVALNVDRGLARQVVLRDAGLSVRRTFRLDAEPTA
jgi:flagellar assembly factor FliW